MKTVAAEDAVRQLAELLAEVGGCFAITRDGAPIARLVPAEKPERTRAEVIADIREFGRQHRGALRGLSIRELIDDGRRY